jgi:hypothetical protein
MYLVLMEQNVIFAGKSLEILIMVTKEEAEVLRRFDTWLATKVHTNNHRPFVRGAIKAESDDFKHGFNMAIMLVSVWVNDIANGHYDTNKHDLQFDTLEILEEKWEKALNGESE